MRGKKVSLLLAIIIALSLVVSPAIAETGVKDGGNPIITGTEVWEADGVGASWVLYDGSSTYMMWYSGKDIDGFTAIGYATASLPEGPWTKDGSTPVLLKGDIGEWDAYGVGGPCVIYDTDDSLYKMWYTGMDASQVLRIGYATAVDPEGPWTKDAGNPVVDVGDAGSWDENGVGGPCVIREDATTYKMWYTGRDDNGTGLGLLAIGYTTSTDGITGWDDNKESAAVMEKSATATDWDGYGVGAACVMQSGVGAEATYSMYYTGYGDTTQGGVFAQIGMAQSGDGLAWTPVADINPVLEIGAIASWEENGVGSPCAVKVDGLTNIWYTGSDNNLLTGIGYATAFPFESTTLNIGWNMFALPLNPVGDDYDFNLVIGDDVLTSLYFFWYNPAAGKYDAWPSDDFPAEISRGYWLRLYADDVEVDVEGVDAETATYADAPTVNKEFYAINLGSPWNMIGCPFNYQVEWAECLIYHDSTYYTIAESHAVPGGLVSQYIFAYNSVEGRYDSYDVTDGVLTPWAGYWIRAYQDAVLLVPPTEYVAP
ncbi:hypothetical protein ACFLTS_05860 [Chloroflexota bacterium]